MASDTVCIPREEYELLLEEVGILRNPEMADAIEESDRERAKGSKTWELDI